MAIGLKYHLLRGGDITFSECGMFYPKYATDKITHFIKHKDKCKGCVKMSLRIEKYKHYFNRTEA